MGGLVVFASVRMAGPLPRRLSRPIGELVGWTRLIRRREPLPAGESARGAPDFDALRQGLRQLASALDAARSEEHTSELQSRSDLVCRLLLEKKQQPHPHTPCRPHLPHQPPPPQPPPPPHL